MTKTNTLSEKLKKYTMLTGSALATTLAANGQVIYTDVDPDFEMGGLTPASYPYTVYDTLDLNNDGLFDFKLMLSILGTNPSAPGFDFFQQIDGNFNPLNNIFTYTLGYAPLVFPMDCNDSVPLNQQFYGLNYAVFSFQFGDDQANNWNNIHDKYVGLSFNVAGQQHYGWLRLDVNTKDTLPNIVVKEYAYEATAGKKIGVCDTGLGPSGINELARTEETLSVYPNPSTGWCTIRMEEPLNGDGEILVKDLSGRELFREEVSLSSTRREVPVDLSSLPPGVYLIQLRTGSQLISAKWTRMQ
jgi:hypothetical protein